MSTDRETTMPKRGNTKPWITPDFTVRFREAIGRNMTRKEREFFGLDDANSEEQPVENDISDPVWLA